MISIIPVLGLPEIREGDDLAALVVELAELQDSALQDADVLVLAQKGVSKAEGRIVHLDGIEASETAVRIASGERDPREIEVILGEAKRIIRERGPLVITETQHGFICASAGVDHSNAPGPGMLVLLPLDPDASARRIRARVLELTGRSVGVVITDSFGRPFRQGTTDVAIGIAGIPAIIDLRGTKDRIGYELRASRTAIADEIAAASDLARGKADGVPAVIVRGLHLEGEGTAQDIVIEPELDLFA
jgi:coenzyme F420-0:L-glutamate ligase/coenzyme F420-1:gamma-L-glutamate ligase